MERVVFTASYNKDTKEIDVNLKKGDKELLKEAAYAIYGKLAEKTVQEKLEEIKEDVTG